MSTKHKHSKLQNPRPMLHRKSSGFINIHLADIERISNAQQIMNTDAGMKGPPPPPDPPSRPSTMYADDFTGQVVDNAAAASGNNVERKNSATSISQYSSIQSNLSADGISIDDIMVPNRTDQSLTRSVGSNSNSASSMTDGLSVMEKLKLAAKLDSSNENIFLKELLETSIRDLEKEKKRKHHSSSRGERSRDKSSRHSSKHKKRGKPQRSLDRSLNSSKRSERSASSRKSQGSCVDSIASGISATSTTAAVPKEVRKVFSRVRGGEPLPREELVSTTIRRLFIRSKINENASVGSHDSLQNTDCVALVPDRCGSEGIGKSTLAGLVCSHLDVRGHYSKGVVWIDLKQLRGGTSRSLDFDCYMKALGSILSQCGISSHHLNVNLTPMQCQDASLRDIQTKIQMKEARSAMGSILSSSKYFPKKRKTEDESHRKILIVLDDLVNEADVEWFIFRYRGEKEVVNDILVTSNKRVEGSVSVPVPVLSEEEAIKLVLMEAHLQTNHQISKTVELKEILRRCQFHPLTIKFVGRWLNLKRTTTGYKSFDEILREIKGSLNATSGDPVDVLYAMLNQAIAPLVKGKGANIIRLCFVALYSVFFRDCSHPSIPLDIANDFFYSVVESGGHYLSENGVLPCPLYQSHGRHAAKLVPEILGALSIFNITKHSTKEKSIQIDHETICRFGDYLLKDETMQKVSELSLKQWHESYAKPTISQYNWKDPQPDRSQSYALQKLPWHMVQAEMFDSAFDILLDETFIQGRILTLGLIEGIKVHALDVETFWMKFHSRDECRKSVLGICEVMDSLLTETVNRDTNFSPGGSVETLEVGRCLLMVAALLGKIGLLVDSAKYCDKCVELVYGSTPSESFASLLFNTATLYLEANKFESAKEIGDLVLAMRGNLTGTDSVLYARSLCMLGDILFKESDYDSAESHFKKCIAILNVKVNETNLDLGVALFKIGLNDLERGLYDDALKRFDQSSEFVDELPPNHEYFVNIYYHMGTALLKKGSNPDAKYAFEQALTCVREIEHKSNDLIIRAALTEGALHSVNGDSEEAMEKYQEGLNLLKKHAPSNVIMIARTYSLISDEFLNSNDTESASEMCCESLSVLKQSVGPMHSDVADVLIKLSSIKGLNGKHGEAARHLDEAIKIQRSRLGECEELAINLTKLGGHLKAAGDTQKALDVYTNSLLILRVEGQKVHLVDTLSELGDLHNSAGEYKSAVGCYNECVTIQKSLFSDYHNDVASTLYSIGVAEMNWGHYEKSLSLLNESIDIIIALNGETHPFIGDAYNMMGFVEMKSGNADGALQRFADALQVRVALGLRLKEAESLKNIGNVYREKDELDHAIEQYEECMSIITEEEGSDSEALVEVLIAMGNISSDMKYHDEAMSHYRNALANLLIHHSENHDSVASILQKMGMMQFQTGNLESSLAHLEKSVGIYRQLGKDHEYKVIPSLFVIGNIHSILKCDSEAEQAWRKCYEVFGGLKNNPYLYPEIKGSLTELLNNARRRA